MIQLKKAILLYNPHAGHGQIIQYLDHITQRLQMMGYELRLYRSEEKGSLTNYILNNVTASNTDLILISGGDGTLNECINGLGKKNLDLPIGILPFGTANDFAYSAGIPNTIEGALQVIEKGKAQYIDIGKVNDHYFINVCNVGLFSGISHIVDQELKKKFGKLAYYVKGIEELHHYRSMPIEIRVDNVKKSGEYLQVLVFNGKAAGGFTKLAKNADIQDGTFDVICIKKVEIHEVPLLFLKVLQGEHLNDPRIDYFIGEDIEIKCKNNAFEFVTDIDGELGPQFPLMIQLQKQAIRVYLLRQ